MKKIYRKITSLALISALLLSFLPVLPTSRVEAAPTGLYFLPDDTNLNATANMDTTSLNRNSVFKTSSQNLSVPGSFQVVAKDTLSATVEKLTFDSTTSTWIADSANAVSSSVTALSTNRFQASNVSLFAGYNRITLKGIQSNIEKSDAFYVLFEDAPVLQSLKVGSGTGSPVNLNEGASIVLSSNSVYFQGVVLNGTKVTINNVVTSILADGSFFSQTIILNAGINDITFVFENQTSMLTVNRTIYYYDPANPFINLDVNHVNDVQYSLLSAIPPTLTGVTSPPAYVPSSDDKASLHVKMLVPYSPLSFSSTVSLNVYGLTNGVLTATPVTVAASPALTEITIPSNTGTASYKLVDFTTTSYPFETAASAASALQSQSVTLGVYYDAFSTSIKKYFKYSPGEIAINNISYLNTDPATTPMVNLTGPIPASLPALNNSDVKSDQFYIVVDTDRPIPTTMNLNAILLPLSAATVSVAYVGSVDTLGALDKTNGIATRTKRQVYLVTNLPVGAQRLQFKILTAPAVYLSSTFTANVNYVSGSYVYLENITDGKTFNFDSTNSVQLKKVPVKGSFIGFTGFLGTNAELYVNGVSNTTFRTAFTAPTGNNFDFTLNMSNSADSLFYGENHLVFIAKYISPGSTQMREIRKEIKVYILDTHEAYVSNFQPGLVPTTSGGRESIQTGTHANIFKDPTQGGIVFKTNKWVTSLKTYDVVVDAGAASVVTLIRNGVSLLQYTLPPSPQPGFYAGIAAVAAVVSPPAPAKPAYEVIGDQDHFILRVLDLTFDAPGAHIYTLELRNSSGARVTQKLQIDRELAQYRVLSPISTVGDKIVVNKNFIHFDIEAEGADSVLVDGKLATKRDDINDRFVYDYIGLKPGKVNTVKIAVKQSGAISNGSVDISYISSFEPGAQFMEKLSTKHSIFDKRIEINFPTGTALKATNALTNTIQYYNSNNLLFGLAEPRKGLVEARNDYGNLKGMDIDSRTNANTPGGQYTVLIPDALVMKYQSELDRANFTPISPVYWINAGLGEKGTKGKPGYQPPVNGIDPYAVEGTFTFDPDRKLEPTNRGTISLKYDSSVVESAGTLINVFVMDETGKWKNLGGEVDARNNAVKVPFSQFGYYMVTKMRYGFTDVTNHPWARNVLEGLFSKGLMPNLRYQEFGSDDSTTRGEFTTLLVKALNIPLNYDDNNSFLDVPFSTIDNEHITWDYKHIETAARIGIISGLDNRVFAPESKLTREQAATIIARALELKLAVNDSKLLASLSKSFTDADPNSMSFYAIPAIDAVVKAGIMVGKDHAPTAGQKKGTVTFDSKSNLNRAEAGQIAVRLLQKATKIFPTNLN